MCGCILRTPVVPTECTSYGDDESDLGKHNTPYTYICNLLDTLNSRAQSY
jgi:hypothetical protein